MLRQRLFPLLLPILDFGGRAAGGVDDITSAAHSGKFGVACRSMNDQTSSNSVSNSPNASRTPPLASLVLYRGSPDPGFAK
jgi:hypothetical protein